MRNLRKVFIFCISVCLVTLVPQTAEAINSKSSACKKMLASISKLDSAQIKTKALYTTNYKIARKSNLVTDNMLQTRALLELYENERTIYLLALDNPKCFSKAELKNITIGLKNTTDDAETIRSWIFVEIGIPGKNFYETYTPFAKYLTTPLVLAACEKVGLKYKTMTCTLKDGNIIWIDSVKPSGDYGVYWPTDFIEGKSNWRDAAKRVNDFFARFSTAASTDGITGIQFQKDNSYPGLFDFNVEPKLTACQKFIEAQNKVGLIQFKYTADISRLIPDPNWVLETNPNGELLANKPLAGQIFSVPIKVDMTIGTTTIPGNYSTKHIALINGSVYRFSAC